MNELCDERKIKAKGVSSDEFGIFVLSMTNYDKIDETAERILEFRTDYESIKQQNFANYREYKAARDLYKNNYIQTHLADFKNPVKNVKEYGDSMKRYLRQTKYIRF